MCSDVKYLGISFVAGVKLEVSLAQKRLMFFRAFNSLNGSIGANFSYVLLKIIIVKHTSPYFCEWRGGLEQQCHKKRISSGVRGYFKVGDN